MLFGRADLFGRRTGNPEGRVAEAEERRAARAQEKLTACRAHERAGRKRSNKNRSRRARSSDDESNTFVFSPPPPVEISRREGAGK